MRRRPAGFCLLAGFSLLAGVSATSGALATPPPIMGAQARAAPPSPAGAPGRLTLRGGDGRSEILTPAEIAATAHVHVTLAHMGESADYAGPELADLLRRVDAPLGARLHGAAVADVVLVSASDGYRVALSLGEIDPQTRGDAKVILADQKDGRPLPPGEGPYRLVIAGEARPARDVRSVIAVELRALR